VPQRACQGLWVVGAHEHSRVTVDDRLPSAARVDRDDRPTGRMRLDSGDAELLDVRDDERCRAGIDAREIRVAHPAEELGM
jgi:hypothetical protein